VEGKTMATQRNDQPTSSDARDDRVDRAPATGGQPQSEPESFGRSFTGRPGPLTQWGSGERDGQREGERDGATERAEGTVGLQRSDERLRVKLCDVFADAHDLDTSDIRVSVQNGQVTLTGVVPDRLSKRRAEEHIERMSGVKGVINDLSVRQAQQSALDGVIG
jgi:BON domain